MLLCLKGQDKHCELKVVSWAAACTRAAYVAQVQAHGVAFTGPPYFTAGLALIFEGWDMSARVAQLAGNLQDIEALRAMQAQQAQLDDEAVEKGRAGDPSASGAGSGLAPPLGNEDDQSPARLQKAAKDVALDRPPGAENGLPAPFVPQAAPIEAALSEQGMQEYEYDGANPDADPDPNGEPDASDSESPRAPARL